MKISEQGIALIKKFEGFSAVPYLCPAGKNTIGYGHVIGAGEIFPNGGINEAEAETLLMQDVTWVEETLCRYVTIPLTQNQFDALCSFIYNVGASAFIKSTLRKKLNAGDLSGTYGEFGRWVFSNRKILPGLIARRVDEARVFLNNINIQCVI